MQKIMIIGDIESTMMVHAMAGLANAQGIEIIAQTENPFKNYEPIELRKLPIPEIKQIEYRDKKGKLFEPPKSKFHR